MSLHFPKIGILGGGQLARMLCLKGHELGVNLYVFSESKEDPAAQVTQQWFQGRADNEKDLLKFIKSVDQLTFESEFIDCQLLAKVLSKTNFNKNGIFPSLNNMETLQDRWLQKNLFKEFLLPTAPFFKIDSVSDIETKGKYFNFRYVLKKRFGGYDGYGTYISKNLKDHQNIIFQLDSTLSGKQNSPVNSLNSKGFIVEEFVSFKNELACQYFRNARGEFYHLPLVESFQSHSKCDWVKGPIQHPNFNSITKKIKTLMNKQNYVGTLAFEFFNTKNGLLINESAPRVHNSGHYSLNYPIADQFSLHLKATNNKKFPSKTTDAKFSFVMINLVGKSNTEIIIPSDLSGFLHLYGKKENRSGRKMGHVNYIDNYSLKNSNSLLKKALTERKKIKL
ncbi:MAG: ATP-grasp domain-containing protein [Deltaproteobacteria bacterium]|nr:ATP-grasp domain-containing protein [Deltaproteobacteria bacterium]